MRHSTSHSRRFDQPVRRKRRKQQRLGEASTMITEFQYEKKMRALCNRNYIVECWDAPDGWRTQIRHLNGNLLYSSEEDYSSKRACLKTAGRFAFLTGAKLVIL